MISIPYILQNLGSWVRPGNLGALFITLERNFYLDIMAQYTFIPIVVVPLVSSFHTDIHTHMGL